MSAWYLLFIAVGLWLIVQLIYSLLNAYVEGKKQKEEKKDEP